MACTYYPLEKDSFDIKSLYGTCFEEIELTSATFMPVTLPPKHLNSHVKHKQSESYHQDV